MGFGQLEEPVNQQASADNGQYSVHIWQGLSQRLIEEDFRILTETWTALDQSKTVSNESVDNLGSVIRRTLFRMWNNWHVHGEQDFDHAETARVQLQSMLYEIETLLPSPLSQHSWFIFSKKSSHEICFRGPTGKVAIIGSRLAMIFCCKINELALIWRDLDHRILSQERVFNTEFKDRVDQS